MACFRACGRVDNVLGPYMSSDFDMTIVFTSDSTVQGAGFTAVYNFSKMILVYNFFISLHDFESGLCQLLAHIACVNYPCPAHAACITGPEGNPYCQCDYHYQGQNCDSNFNAKLLFYNFSA